MNRKWDNEIEWIDARDDARAKGSIIVNGYTYQVLYLDSEYDGGDMPRLQGVDLYLTSHMHLAVAQWHRSELASTVEETIKMEKASLREVDSRFYFEKFNTWLEENRMSADEEEGERELEELEAS